VVRHTSVANGILGADGPEDALRVLRALCRDDRALLAAA